GFLAQMENGQTCGQVLIIWRGLRDQVRCCLDDGFMDIFRLNAVIELNMGLELNLRHGNMIQTFCGPRDNAVNFIQINRFFSAVTFGDQECAVHCVCISMMVDGTVRSRTDYYLYIVFYFLFDTIYSIKPHISSDQDLVQNLEKQHNALINMAIST